jgi:hypothetical protein
MKRIAFSICIATVALGLGACEQHSADTLPDHYKHKGSHHAGAGHDTTPAHDVKEKAPADEHKG